MDTFTYTQIRNNFLEDYSATEETLHLMKSPTNATRLAKAMSDIFQGKIIEKEII